MCPRKEFPHICVPLGPFRDRASPARPRHFTLPFTFVCVLVQAPWHTTAFEYFSYWVKSAPQPKGMSVRQFVARVAQAEAGGGGGGGGSVSDASAERLRYYLHSALSWRDRDDDEGGGGGGKGRPVSGHLHVGPWSADGTLPSRVGLRDAADACP